ncbi:hypothetical protein D6C84_00973 [Aureobasidium pullulans]|uniref:rhomboid protease n=1 Tax=Aureobasidium pullulans TaxID=5580 RepID=A0A4S9Y5T0_AURPU|nr:hypothetical protein D6C84_00973 [Aureobasidium pullulans]
MPSLSLPQFDARRVRSYLFRLPLCTRALLVVIVAFWIASLRLSWFQQWAALIPAEMNLQSMYRLNTFPLLHVGFIHMIVNIFALTPLLERFEAENGSLPTLLLFTGPFGLLPGGSYTLIEKFIFHANTAVQGASVWVFLLLASESIKTFKQNPNFALGPYNIPTWTIPLILNLFVAVLVPNTSFLGHLCGLAVGYLWGLGFVKFLVPNEKILRWIEGKLNLLGRLPHYVSVDQKTYGRYGVLPTTATPRPVPTLAPLGSTQRLGP